MVQVEFLLEVVEVVLSVALVVIVVEVEAPNLLGEVLTLHLTQRMLSPDRN